MLQLLGSKRVGHDLTTEQQLKGGREGSFLQRIMFRLDLVGKRGPDWLLLVPIPIPISCGRRSGGGLAEGLLAVWKPGRTGYLYSALNQDCGGEGSTLGPQGFCDQPDPFTVFRVFTSMSPILNSQSVSQFSHSVMSDSLRSHGLQHTRLPCPSTTPRACSNSCPLSR